jgi:hypothetical protein
VNRLKIGSALFVCGGAAFLLGLFGLAGEGSFAAAVVGVLAAMAGAAVLLFSLMRGERVSPHPVVVAGLVLAVLLHAYEQFAGTSTPFSFAWFLWPLVPYAACLAVAVFRETRVAAIGGVVTAMAVDVLVHFEVFISPSSSSAGLAMLFAPIWSLLVFTPVAMLVTWFVARRKSRDDKLAP